VKEVADTKFMLERRSDASNQVGKSIGIGSGNKKKL